MDLAWSGVDLFFVLSGFLIGGIVLDNRDAANFNRVFYARRATRILPPYALLLASFALAGALWPAPRGAALDWLLGPEHPFWTYALFVQNFWMAANGSITEPAWLGPTWSLAIEEQFYLSLPLLLRACPPRLVPHALLALILATPLVRLGVFIATGGAWQAVYVLLPTRADGLLMGVLAAWGMRQPAWRQRLRRSERPLLAGLAMAGLLVGLLRPGAGGASLLTISLGFTFVDLFYLLLLLIGINSARPWVAALYSIAPLRGLGTISYFVYLFHLATLGAVSALVWGRSPWPGEVPATSSWTLPLLALGVTLAMASGSFRWLERPIIRLGHRLRYRAPVRPSPRPPAPSSPSGGRGSA
jgi:peptidoglycan/LPS O-acetylase OafA/YrhL